MKCNHENQEDCHPFTCDPREVEAVRIAAVEKYDDAMRKLQVRADHEQMCTKAGIAVMGRPGLPHTLNHKTRED